MGLSEHNPTVSQGAPELWSEAFANLLLLTSFTVHRFYPVSPYPSDHIRAYPSWTTQTNIPAHRKSATNVSYYHDYFCHYLAPKPKRV